MVYDPRYQRPFVGTTVTIQDDAITPDKLADKAVEEKHLADDVVSERNIGSDAVLSETIKDKEVKTADLDDLSVTGAKIAESTIPESKLTFTPSTRPLSPAAGSTEILDDAIVESKYADDSIPTAAYKPGSVDEAALGGDAVTEVKIKDRNVTAAKVALDSLGNEHLKADSVRGTEIQDGAVSTPKLSTDAVETIKVKDFNVTEPKLTTDILRKLLDDRQLFYDDFLGAASRSEWAYSGDPFGSQSRANSELTLITGPVNADIFRANFGGVLVTADAENPVVFARLWPEITNIHIRFGLINSPTKYVLFDFDTAVDGNWHTKTRDGGAETDFDTAVPATVVMHDFMFIFQAGPLITFSIDGVTVNVENATITASAMQPLLEIQTRAAALRRLHVDKYILSTIESAGAPPP